MFRPQSPGFASVRGGLALALATLLFSAGAGADGASGEGSDFEPVVRTARRLARQGVAWYVRTPPADRITWGGLSAAAALGLGVALERWARLRRHRIVPKDFAARFVVRLQEGKLDRGKALDYCELNPSPAARVALGAVRRWDRPVGDQERAVAMTCRVETDRLRRNVGTLRRIAALAPLLGLLGTLLATGRALTTAGNSSPVGGWAPALGAALGPLTAGVALAIIALVAYDGLVGRVESLAETLERLGAETVDAIAMAAPLPSRPNRPHQGVRLEVPEPHVLGRPARRDDEAD